jgi:hypothetical protein
MDHQSSPQLAGSYDQEPGPRLGRLGMVQSDSQGAQLDRVWPASR